jgi:hypothetical protein
VEPPVPGGGPRPWRLIDGTTLHEELPPSDHAFAHFAQLCRQKTFPFGRCPTCGTIFARVKRQRYCSPACKDKAFVTARRDERREYMRRYMAARRAKMRKTRRTKGR